MGFINFKRAFYNITHWETWHYLAKYIPIAPAWFWYAIRSRSVWWFTPSNPTLTFGGFEGEKKREMYEQLPESTYPKTIYIKSTSSLNGVLDDIKTNGFSFPFAVKPDAGMMGFMFRKISNTNELKGYHSSIRTDYVLQELVQYPLEVSVFYYRFPGAEKGTITGFLKKEYLQVKGNGIKTLDQLIDDYPRAHLKIEEIKLKNKRRLYEIIKKDEIIILSHALNLSRGGKLVSLENEIDHKLLGVFDKLSHYSKSFYYGRYDIKCRSIEDLKNGQHFYILEFNGSGAEPHHIYGNGNSLIEAYAIVLRHWKILYQISRINNRNGISYWPFMKGWKFLSQAKKHFRLLKKADTSFQY